MSENKLNISNHTTALLKQLCLDPPFVKELRITPSKVTATMFKRDKDGKKHLTDDHTAAATETIEYDVRT